MWDAGHSVIVNDTKIYRQIIVTTTKLTGIFLWSLVICNTFKKLPICVLSFFISWNFQNIKEIGKFAMKNINKWCKTSLVKIKFITTTLHHYSLSWAIGLHPTFPPPDNLPKIHSNPILSSTPRFSEWSLSHRLFHLNLVHFPVPSHVCHMHCPVHSPWFDLPNDTWEWVQNMKPGRCHKNWNRAKEMFK
jgi:hypothetical protein